MIKFQDFAIKILRKGNWSNTPIYEEPEETLLRINYWIEDSDISVMNIETLIMPNIHNAVSPEKTADTYFITKSGESKKNRWFQIYRVWYKDTSQKKV